MEFVRKSSEEEMGSRVACDLFPNSHRQNEQAVPVMDLSLRMDSNNNGVGVGVEKEHMFDKVVTPSDVGKLNRLVIPKQHAEKYFPLDSTTNDKGLILNFEDPNGKPWRFRYSYWNSSQSYVMTKGWSRFVKDKKLDPGDVVSFLRAQLANHRLFIDCHRRPPSNPLLLPHFTLTPPTHHHLTNYSNHYPNYNSSMYYLRPSISSSLFRMGSGDGIVVSNEGSSMGVNKAGSGRAAAKRLRLFGVNMECGTADGDGEEDLSNKRSFNWDLDSDLAE